MNKKSIEKQIKTLQNKLNKGSSLIDEIVKLLDGLFSSQKDLFFKMYPTFPDIDFEKLPHALSQCQRTVELNFKRDKELKELIPKEFKKEIEKRLGTNLVERYSEAKDLLAQLQKEKEEQDVLKSKIDITKGLPKVSKEDQKKSKLLSFNSEEEAVEYFTEEGREFFQCGEGSYQDEARINCFINDAFFDVKILAEVLGRKQDIGDKYYWVENITSVELTSGDFDDYKDQEKKKKEELIKQKEIELKKLKEEL